MVDEVAPCHNWVWCLEQMYFVVEVHCVFMHAVVDDDVLQGFCQTIVKRTNVVVGYKFIKRDCLHRDLGYSIPLDKSKQFNSYVQIQLKYLGFV